MPDGLASPCELCTLGVRADDLRRDIPQKEGVVGFRSILGGRRCHKAYVAEQGCVDAVLEYQEAARSRGYFVNLIQRTRCRDGSSRGI